VTSGGTISGGTAVNFSGGGNTLTLEVGSSTTGNITSTSGSTNGGDTLILGDNASGGGSDSLDAGSVSGFNTYEKAGTSTWALTGVGVNQDWQVQGGTLVVGDAANPGTSIAGNVQVSSGATLSGYGTVGGNGNTLMVQSGGILTPGVNGSTGTLTVGGNLVAAQGSVFNFAYGTPGANFQTAGSGDSVNVSGNAELDGTTLNVINAGGMGPGLYNVLSYAGTLTETNGGLTLGSTPSGETLLLQNLTAQKQINLIDSTGYTLNVWNANSQASSTQMGGGSGTWSATSPEWTDATGTVANGPMSPQPGFAIFGGTAGTVTVDNGAGTVSATGLQFAVDGYVLTGDALTLVANNGVGPVIRVGDGSSAGASMTATIENALVGTDGLAKSDLGTLVLTGTNTYTGGTFLEGGTLSVSSDANLGDASGGITFEGGMLEVTGTTYTSTARTITLQGAGGGFDIADAGNTFTLSQALTGNGGFVKSGAGTLTLSGINAYTGATMIDAGTLALSGTGSIAASSSVVDNGTLDISGTTSGASIVSLSGSGTVNLGNQTLTLSNASGNFAGVMGGTGGLTLAGGTQTLDGINAYTGVTTINAGTLALSGNGSLSASSNVIDNGTLDISSTTHGASVSSLSGNGTVTLGSQALVLNNASGSFSGVITGTGGLTLGGGTEIVSGANTYTGSTTIASGSTLALSGSGSVAHSSQIVDSGTFDISRATSAVSITNVSGAGSVKLGSNTLALTTASGAFNGVMSGAGGLTVAGSGTFTLTGANTYTGTTTITSGILQVGNDGNSGSISNTVVDSGTLTFDRSDDLTYAGSISGKGNFVKLGDNTLILDGSNTYTGSTTVDSGTLEVGDASHATASIAGDVGVDGNGTLRGHGSVDGNVVNDGIVWPGGSIGTLTINGNYLQNSDGTLQFDLTPGGASQLVATGTATLAGTLHVIYAPGTYTTRSYALIQAGAVQGSFSAIVDSGSEPAGETLHYTSNAVDLSMASATVAPLDASIYGDLERTQNLIGQSTLSTLADLGLRGTNGCGPQNGQAGALASACNSGVWAQYSGSADSLSGALGMNSTSFGILAGYDVAAGDVAHIGVEAGYNRVNGNDHLGGNGNVDSPHGGIYAFANAGPLVLSATVDQTMSTYRVQRQTGFGPVASNPDGGTTGAALQAAWPLVANAWTISPALGALYQHQHLDGFSETIASNDPLAPAFTVQGARSTYNTLQPYANVHFGRAFQASGVTYLPQFELGYRYDTRDQNAAVVTMTTEDGTVFQMPGERTGKGMATAGARISAQAGTSWSLYLDYQGQFASHEHDNALSVGFTKHF
jgi:autotransporter-associated beta strand protein